MLYDYNTNKIKRQRGNFKISKSVLRLSKTEIGIFDKIVYN